MTPLEEFHSSLAAGDFPTADAALIRYLEPLRSGTASLAELAAVRSLIDGGLRAAVDRRAVLARDLFQLRQLQRGFRPGPAANTWEING